VDNFAYINIAKQNNYKMREIKFRAMKDDISNCSFQHGQITFDTNGCPRIHFSDGMSTSCLKGTEGQFTGLIDKKGLGDVCLYEGDILSLDGNIKGNIHEKQAHQEKYDLVIPEITGKDWPSAYKKAVDRGFGHSK
jgi:hypothetical protein